MIAIQLTALLLALCLFVAAVWEHNTEVACGWGTASALWVTIIIRDLRDRISGGGQ